MNGLGTLPNIAVAHPDRLYIGGRWSMPSTDRRLSLVNPANERQLLQVAEAVEADVDAAVLAARQAFDEGPWPRLPGAERGRALRRLLAQLRARVPDLSNAWTQQMGAVHALAEARTQAGLGYLEFCGGLGESFNWVERLPTSWPGHQGLLVHEPVGVVAAIVPWNAPLQTMLMKVAPALIAGCTLVVKPAPETPLEAYIFAEAAEAAGLPPGVINVIAADRTASEHLVRNPGVDKVSFTGSPVAGRRIAAICGERIARVTLELGGKSAALILDDYDLVKAADDLTPTTCALSGQICSNITRYLVPRMAHDRFAALLAERYSAVQVGNPYDPTVQMGPLASRRQLERVQNYIELGRRDGAELVVGGGRPAHLNEGYFIEPTLFANVDNRSRIAQEEIFGPVACVIAYDDLDDAVRLANESDFGLGGAVLTNDVDRAYHVARRIRTGTVGHQGSRTDFSIGFGGFKQSGIGREGGVQGLLPYLENKTIVLAGMPSDLAA
jgi:aldehyde dehydrogenase (NAD+)